MNAGDILKGMLTSAFNALFAVIAAFLVKHGIVDASAAGSEQLAYLAGAAASGLVYLILLYYRKKIQHYVVQFAHDSPASTPINEIKSDAKAKALPTVLGGEE